MSQMIISKTTSASINYIRFFLCVLVVFLHSGSDLISLDVNFTIFGKFLIKVLTGFICQTAVPIFFFISAFLLFSKYRNSTNIISEYKIQQKKRIKTLLVPYLLWNLFGVIYVYIKCYFKGDSIDEYPNFFLCFIALPDKIFPADGPLWFIRDLIIMNVLSPILYVLFKNKHLCVCAIGMLLICHIFKIIPTSLYPNLYIDVIFYPLGAAFGLLNLDSGKFGKTGTTCLLLACVFIVLCRIYTIFFPDIIDFSLLPIFELFFLFLLISIGNLLPPSPGKMASYLLNYSQYCFFIYALHGLIIKPILIAMLKVTSIVSFSEIVSFIYIIAPIITIAVCVLCQNIIKSYSYKLYSILTGNR